MSTFLTSHNQVRIYSLELLRFINIKIQQILFIQ